MPDFDDAKWDELVGILSKVRPGLSEGQEGVLLGRARCAVHELVSSRKVSGPDEEKTLRVFLDCAAKLVSALDSISSHQRLRYRFNSVLREYIRSLRASMGREWEWARPREDDDFDVYLRHLPLGVFMTLPLRNLIVQIAPLADALNDANKITHQAEYKFVSDVASAWHQITGRVPSVTRSTDLRTSKRFGAEPSPPSTAFQRFLTAAVPHPPIKHEIVRAVLKELKERVGGLG